ncbi:MAG TPA: hypothetical protein VNS61_14150 [Caldimonas sp.]|nr:hypothetical protein [Caldimonas sp.]
MRAALTVVLSKRLAVLVIGLAGAVALASSCSIDAAVTTDRAGRVLALNAVRVESSLREFGLVMLVSGRDLVLELTWRRGLQVTGS